MAAIIFRPSHCRILEANRTAGAFFQRQFWQCVKLLDNALKWHGIIADKPLQELAFDGLLNRYIVLGLQNSPVNHNSVYASQVVSKG
jgi:GC-rich sequence DNA-binding factor